MCELRGISLLGAGRGRGLGSGDAVNAVSGVTARYRRVEEKEHNALWASVGVFVIGLEIHLRALHLVSTLETRVSCMGREKWGTVLKRLYVVK